MNAFFDLFKNWNGVAVILRLVFSMLCGIIIGIDREMKNRTAGVKTHVLVCLGAALVMIMSEYINHTFPLADADMNRMGAQVISGIGFLGAGTILVTKQNRVQGLTTAAGLWVTACIGLSIGIGFIEGGLVTVFLFVFTVKVLDIVDVKLHEHSRKLQMYIEFTDMKAVRTYLDTMRKNEIKISNLNLIKPTVKGEGPIATLDLEIPKDIDKTDYLLEIQDMSCVKYYEEV